MAKRIKKGQPGYVAVKKWTLEELKKEGDTGRVIYAIRGAIRAGNASVETGKNFEFKGLFKGKSSEQGWANNATRIGTGHIFDTSSEDITKLMTAKKLADKDLADRKYSDSVHNFLKLAKSTLVGKGGGGGVRSYETW